MRVSTVIDIALAAFTSAILIGRALFVALDAAYDAANPAANAPGVTEGILTPDGLSWHGVVWGGIAGARLASWWVDWRRARSFSPSPEGEGSGGWPIACAAIALVLPLITIASWQACAAIGCSVGAEIDTLARAPLFAAELPDRYGVMAPRWNTPLIGQIGAIVTLFAAAIALRRDARGAAGVSLAGIALLMTAISVLRAAAPLTFALDAAMLVTAIGWLAGGEGSTLRRNT